MKYFRSTIIVLILLLMSTAGVMAANVTQPQYYINQNGVSTPITAKLQPFPGSTNNDEAGPEAIGNPEGGNKLIPGTWYWCGGGETGKAVDVTTPVTIDEPNATVEPINLVVGPNGTGGEAAAMTVKGGLKIPSGITVNVYQAADGLETNTPVQANQCFLYFNASGSGEESGTNVGITVDAGATLNAYSGVIVGVGNSGEAEDSEDGGTPTAPNGVLVNGTVNIGQYGALEGDAPSGTPGISIGTLSGTNKGIVSSGTLCSFLSGGTQTNGALGNTIGSPSGLTVNNGAVYTSTPYSEVQNTSTISNGVWFQTSNTNGNLTANAFGQNPTYIYTAYKSTFSYGESLVIPAGTTLTMANGTFTFGTENGSGTGTAAKLTVNGTLNIGTNDPNVISSYFVSTPYAQADITMYSNSTLENTGTINVAPPPQSSNS